MKHELCVAHAGAALRVHEKAAAAVHDAALQKHLVLGFENVSVIVWRHVRDMRCGCERRRRLTKGSAARARADQIGTALEFSFESSVRSVGVQHEMNSCGAFARAGMNVKAFASGNRILAEIEASGASIVYELAASFWRVAQQHELGAAAFFYGVDCKT